MLSATAVFMPITWPEELTSGPPELPELMAASVCRSPVRFSLRPVTSLVAVSERSFDDTMPSVTREAARRAPSALPMASTSSPTCAASESPSSHRRQAVLALDLDEREVLGGVGPDDPGRQRVGLAEQA